jgi:hypothetical protein
VYHAQRVPSQKRVRSFGNNHELYFSLFKALFFQFSKMGDMPLEKISGFRSLTKCFGSVGTAEEVTEEVGASVGRLTKGITGGGRTGFAFKAVRRNSIRF